MMNDGIAAALILGVIFFGIVSIIRTITDYQLRRKLIQLGHVDKHATGLLQKPQDSRLASLKWGLIILFGGIGLIIVKLIGIDNDDILFSGVEAICIAIGFLTYYFVSRTATETPPYPDLSAAEKSSVDYINS